jgi:glycosyltransferase involved in cell wall biosynthesis
MIPLSAVVITFNNAKKLAKCIEALRGVTDDIVVVDSFSTDNTAQICQEKNVRYFQKAWIGYSDQKNFGNEQAKNDWIVSIDDDEFISEVLAKNILEKFDKIPDFDAINLPFRTVFCGKLIRFGSMNPESHVRVFNKKLIHWNTEDVHEQLTIGSHHRIEQVNGYVFHHTVDTPEQFAQKTDRYAQLFAEKAKKMGKKSLWLKRFISPSFRFIREYFFKLGFLDGYYGWFIAKENARYTYLKYQYLAKNTL